MHAQQGLIEFAQELKEDDLNTRMPDIIKKSGWNRQVKSHDKVNKRLMTGAEAAERDANNREQVAVKEARQETNIALTASFLTRPTPLAGPPPPPAPSDAESAPDNLFCGSAAGAMVTTTTTTTTSVRPFSLTPDEEEEEEEEEEAIEEAFIPPLSTAPAAMTQSRAGRRRAPTMKALEAEQAPIRGSGQGKGRGRGRGRARREAQG